MLTAFHSVVVDVADFEAALRDHVVLLGRAPTRVGVDPVQGSRFARFSLSNVQLELRARALDLPAQTAPPGALGASPGLPFRDGEGIAGLRLAGRFESGALGRLPRIPLAGPSVPIELVDDAEMPTAQAVEMPGSEPDLEPRERIDGLDHVVVASPDPDRAQRFFADDLGLRLALDRRFPERGLRLLFFRLGGVTLEVAAALDAPSKDVEAGRDAFHGLAWQVPRIEKLHARLLAAGFELSALRDGHKPGTRVASLRAPFYGVPTLLIEHPRQDHARAGG